MTAENKSNTYTVALETLKYQVAMITKKGAALVDQGRNLY